MLKIVEFGDYVLYSGFLITVFWNCDDMVYYFHSLLRVLDGTRGDDNSQQVSCHLWLTKH